MKKIAVESQFNNNIHDIKYQKRKQSEKKKRRQNYLHQMLVIPTTVNKKEKKLYRKEKQERKTQKINFSQISQPYKANPQYAKPKKLSICFLRILIKNCQTSLIPDSCIEIQSIIKFFASNQSLPILIHFNKKPLY
ncbi:hypothetical protein ABPG74_014117 [Tetrahymena malaccensis]